jgi:peptidoglycan-associated lipoprotein
MALHRFHVHVIIIGLTAAVAGCHSSTRPNLTPAAAPPPAPARPATPPSPAPPPPRVSAAPAPSRTLTEEELFNRKSLEALNAEHPLADAFFDYNQTELRDDARRALQRDAEWLNRWKSTKILVQGQCDERGSAEYNLALGEQRAKAVRDYLSSLGVPETRVTTVSLGKESPVCREENEDCWMRNRRGHMVIADK